MVQIGSEKQNGNSTLHQEYDVEMEEVSNNDDGDKSIPDSNRMAYTVNEVPPWPSTILFAIQQVMVCTTGIITDPLIVSGLICSAAFPQVKVKLISTVLFMCGLGTIMQATFGIRLPLIQGASFGFITPIQSFADIYKCPQLSYYNVTDNGQVSEKYNVTGGFAFNNENPELEWEKRLAMVQGSLLASSVVQIFLGGTGLVGVLLRFVGPLTTAPLMLLLSLSIVGIIVDHVATSWTSIILMIALLATTLYGQPIKIPVPVYSRAKSGMKLTAKPIFALFPYLMAIAFVWALSAILTATNVLPEGSLGRTDVHADIITHAPWFRMPYPFQWNIGIDFNLGLFFGFVASTIASVVESVGDYHAIARVTNEPKPPHHAVNRGIMFEGLACFIGALLGGGTSLTTYSENVGAVGITKVASRRPLQVAGVMLIVLGIFTKFGAIIATIPEPMIGAQLTISLGIVGGVGLSSIQQADMSLSRNMAILGISCILGMMLPVYVQKHPLWTAPEAGEFTFGDSVLQALNTLFGIQMFVGGAIGCFLDNTVPGATRAQRGFGPDKIKINADKTSELDLVYSYPPAIMKVLNKVAFFKYVPFMPTYKPENIGAILKNKRELP